MIGAVKRLVVVAVAAALVGGCASPGSAAYGPERRPLPTFPPVPTDPPVEPPSSPAAPTTPPTCPPEGVLLQAGVADAAMGLRALGITLLNCGDRDYRVDGYPVVAALDKDHRTLGIKVLHGTTDIAGPIPDWNGPPNPITLEPGREAACVVVWRNTYDDIRQPPVTAPYLRMAPAPGRPAQVLSPRDPLDLGSTGRLGVSPWRLSEPTPHTTPVVPPPSTQPPVPSSIL
jgi:hypothetical protein